MTEAAQNTDSELWREVPGDYYSASIHVTKRGAIGINVGGTVHVMPVRDWHKLATLRAALAPGADGEVEAIRGRHEEYAAVWNFGDQVKQDYQYLEDAHADRATLLRALAAERARRVEVEGALATMTDCQPLPKVYKYTGTAEVDVENMFDVGHRHKSGKQPRDYLMSWLSMFRPFAYATKDDSWGELEKLISIVMNNYVQVLVRAEAARATQKDTTHESD